jgi:hypothetical protein
MRRDIRALLAADSMAEVAPLLAEEVVFHSPVADYSGRDDVAHLLTTIAQVVGDVYAAREFTDGPYAAVLFTGRVGDASVDGMLLQRVEATGAVAEMTLWLRPLTALRQAVAQMRDALVENPLPTRRSV